MASYGCLLEWAGMLGNQKAAGSIRQILDQEKAANQTLNELAKGGANKQAMGEGDEHEKDDEAPDKSPKNGRQDSLASAPGRKGKISLAR